MSKWPSVMDKWARKVHIYASLLTFSAMILFGVVGIVSALEPRHQERARPPAAHSSLDWRPPATLDDTQLAEAIRQRLGLAVSNPPAPQSIRRDAQDRPVFDFFSPNGLTRATFDETAGRLLVERQPITLAAYLVRVHEITRRTRIADWRVTAWAWYIETSVWAMLLMLLTSLWLWLHGRWRDRGAAAAFALGTGAVIIVWTALRS